MDGLIMAAQMILAISIIVGIHELGHLLSAKMFGMRVEKYYIGFPPKIFSFKYKGTEWGLGSIPLGGFVKISGIIDESFDTKHINKEPESWEFRSKPAWQRLIVMLGGVIFNVITGVIIFTLMTFNNGETFISKDEINKNGILALTIGKEVGFKTGDKIIKINDQDWSRDSELFDPNLFLNDNSSYTVLRDNNEMKIYLPENFIDYMSSKEQLNQFLKLRLPFRIDSVYSNAQESGIIKGDKIISVNNNKIIDFLELKQAIEANKNSIIQVGIERDESMIDKIVNVSKEGQIGIGVKISEANRSQQFYNLPESFGIGTNKAFNLVWINIQAFGKMFSGKMDPTKNLSGPIGIAQIFGSEWNWNNFWRIVALLSMVLAFMNLLPIPALDGGHAMFLTYEIISGRKPSEKFLEYSTRFGVIILLGLMSFVIFNDIYKLFS
jgi:regulator of sigma E protease|tara:strand:- start:52212 stop:53525 length:1314 start_codon:yes stop_codon:yes gene_type:complete